MLYGLMIAFVPLFLVVSFPNDKSTDTQLGQSHYALLLIPDFIDYGDFAWAIR